VSLDTRWLAVATVIAVFMAVTVGHVAHYAGSFEDPGFRWLGVPYALAVDAAIVLCAWMTRWKTTRGWAMFGYFLFVAASGAMNAAAVRPWARAWPDWAFAWVYALFPTAAIGLLGFLARKAEEVAEHGKKRGIAAWFAAPKVVETKPKEAEPEPEPELTPSFATKREAVEYWLDAEPGIERTELILRTGASPSYISEIARSDGKGK
jgi:hypothetical protein